MSLLRPVLIAGPTASGKSALALRLARERNGLIINADSMQIYADLNILTARPGEEDLAQAPHRLYGHRDAAEAYSVGQWLDDVRLCLIEARQMRLTPIIVGGTGLYFKALTQGLSDIPAPSEALRLEVRALAETETPAQLHARLSMLDPTTAQKLRPTDPQRILRALEIFYATGQPLSSFQAQRQPPLLQPEACETLFLAPDRAKTYARIDARFLDMMDRGALEEVARLTARRLSPDLPAMRAVGVPGLIAALEGRCSHEEAIERGQKDSRAYAKRQYTFARTQLPLFVWTVP